MGEPKVVIAERLADAAVEALEEVADVVVAVGASRSDLVTSLADASAIIVRSATKVDDELMSAAPQLKVIGRAGIGVDNIDVEAATRRGIMVVNTPDANSISAAEHTMALLLAQARNVAAADRSLHEGRWDRKLYQGVELNGKTLGVLGLGKIGAYVAQRALAFGMEVVAYDPYVSGDRAKRLGVRLASLDDVLTSSDFLTIHLPRTAQTEGMLDAEAFAKMKQGVRIVNVARGGIIDEEDLASAIVDGKVAGAAIDVFASEPTTSSPLFDLPQVTVTPHLGASTEEAQVRAGVSVAKAVVEALSGELVLTAVNLDLGPQSSHELRPFIKLAEQLGKIFTALGRGVPDQLEVLVRGALADEPVKALSLSALKGVLSASSETPVSYVNAPLMARARGMSIEERSERSIDDYQSLIRLSGEVAGRHRTVAGTVMARKGGVLVEVDGYAIEVPLTTHMLLVRNDDSPGCIGRVGSYLGDNAVNISDMVVGRHKETSDAMMAIALDTSLHDEDLKALLDLDGIEACRFIEL